MTKRDLVADVSTDVHPYLLDHGIQGMVVLPGATYLSLALAPGTELRDVAFKEAFVIEPGAAAQLRISFSDSGFSAVCGSTVHAGGAVALAAAPGPAVDLTAVRDRCPNETAGADLYSGLRARGNEYGPAFQGIETLRTGAGEALARVVRRDCDAALLDACLQALPATHDSGGRTYFLETVGRMAVHGHADQACWAHARATGDASGVTGDIVVCDDAGRVLIELEGVRFGYVGEERLRVAVSATFTAEPVEETLAFWSGKLGLPLDVEFAPYNQVFQSLLDPDSLLARNDDGVNVVLVRFEDWARFRLTPRADVATVLAGHKNYRLPNGVEIAHLIKYETDYVYKEIFLDDAYRRYGVDLPDDAVVVDVGANIGLFSLWINEQCRDATVYSFEPSPRAYACLAANAELYGGRAFNVGLSDREQTLPFTFYKNASVFSSYAADAAADEAAVRAVVENMLRDSGHTDEAEIARYADDLMEGRMDSETVDVALRSLSSVIDEQGIDRIDLLKIDVEKAELDVLRGIRDEHWPRIRQLVLEVHDQDGPLIEAVLALLRERGFATHLDEEELLKGSGLYNIYATRGTAAPSAPRLEGHVDELITGLRAAADRAAAPWIVGVCPPSAASAEHDRLEGKLARAIAPLGNVHLFTTGELARLYPVVDPYDAAGDRLGHVPYTPTAFAALGTMIARRVHNVLTPPAKLIALDCDHTLWRGVVGEDGPRGIEPFTELQEFMVRQHEAGMLLALCSKNVAADVEAAFATGMPLRPEHIVVPKVNWNPKSQSLRELADELNLGLDSFVFVDDNPVELAEVAAACPQVLTLQAPEDPAVLDHVWAFDHLRVTAEDRARTAMYAANVERRQAAAAAPSLAEFIDSLKLDIEIREATPADLTRVSQLTHRTNQFNFTTIRRSESEIAQSGLRCLVTRVKDRFGDYGLVGVLLFDVADGAVNVDTFLLSCRVLGRGVEHRMLRELGAQARTEVRVPFNATAKNRPALQFIEAAGGVRDGDTFRLTAATAAALEYRPGAGVEVDHTRPRKSAATGRPAPSALVHEIATTLRDPAQVLAQVIAARTSARPAALGAYAPADGDLEGAIAGIWEEVLGVRPIGRNDRFSDLGGHSLLATRTIARLSDAFEIKLSLREFMGAPTVKELATLIEDIIVREIEAMPD